MDVGGVEVFRGVVDGGAKVVDRSDDENMLVVVPREAATVEANETSDVETATNVSAPP